MRHLGIAGRVLANAWLELNATPTDVATNIIARNSNPLPMKTDREELVLEAAEAGRAPHR